MIDVSKQVEEMIKNASGAKEAHHAMNFTQAALNAAHAAQVLVQTEIDKKALKRR